MILNLYNIKLNIFQDKYILLDQANYLDFPFFVYIGSEQFLLTTKKHFETLLCVQSYNE